MLARWFFLLALVSLVVLYFGLSGRQGGEVAKKTVIEDKGKDARPRQPRKPKRISRKFEEAEAPIGGSSLALGFEELPTEPLSREFDEAEAPTGKSSRSGFEELPTEKSLVSGNFDEAEALLEEVFAAADTPPIGSPSCVKLSSTKRRTGSNKWVISYGLYGGENPRYVAAIKKTVAVHSKVLFPEWTVRIYYDNTISNKTKQFLLSHGAELIPGPASVRNKMCWRFLSAIDPDVERFLSRDADSFLTLREKWAVDEWVKSDKKFHNLRDHPWHSGWVMLGGMWGAVRGAVTDFQSVLEGDPKQEYLADMHLIVRHVWPLLQKDALQHDSFSCNNPKYYESKPFPYPRIGWEHIGGVVINQDTGALRHEGKVSRTRPPPECIPALKPLTLVSDLFIEPRVERQCAWRVEQMDKQEIPGCPSSYGSVCKADETAPCQVQLVRIKDVFADWDNGDGYGPMFDPETVFTQYPLRKIPPSLFKRNPAHLLARIKYFPRLAHVLLPHCETPWSFAVLVLPRLRLILEQLPSSVPILLVRNSVAEKMIPLLSQLDGFNTSRIIWHSGTGHLYYAHEMWFILSSCDGLSTDVSPRNGSSSGDWVVSCDNLRPGADAVLKKNTPIKKAMEEVSRASTFVCSKDSPWLSFVQFLRPGAAMVEVGTSELPVLVEVARRKHITYSFEPKS